MKHAVALVRECRLIATYPTGAEAQLYEWAVAVAHGGIKLLALPVAMPRVTEMASDLVDAGVNLAIGVGGVARPDQLSIAIAAGADFVVCTIADAALIRAAADHKLAVIAGAATPSEVKEAAAAGADMVAITPAGPLGGARYLGTIVRVLPDVPLLAGDVDVESAPAYLEAGAVAAVVERGLFPDAADPSGQEVVTVRASALAEVCGEAIGRRRDHTLTKLLGR